MKPQQGLSERYQRRAQDVTLACKLTHIDGEIVMTSVPPRQQIILPDKVVEVEGRINICRTFTVAVPRWQKTVSCYQTDTIRDCQALVKADKA